MFTYIKLKNFKAFHDVIINFQGKRKNMKNLIVLYGVNGSGKSSIGQAFYFLYKTMHTMQANERLQKLILSSSNSPDDFPISNETLLKYVKKELSESTLEYYVNDMRTIGTSNQVIALEFGFEIQGAAGSYLMEFDNQNIIHERLEYRINKNRGCYFDIENGKDFILNDSLFSSKELYHEIKNTILQYWGKHTLFAILNQKIDEKNESFINENMSSNLRNILSSLERIAMKLRASNETELSSLARDSYLYEHLARGNVNSVDEMELERTEQTISRFFSTLFPNVHYASYHINDGKYELYLNKTQEGNTFNISIKKESSGTQELLELFPFLLSAVAGECVILDEYGEGIHDLLAAKLIEAVAPEITGQLILTTHNTTLMDYSNINPENIYIIMNTDPLKTIKNITEIEDRLRPEYRYQNRYFSHPLYALGLPDTCNSDALSRIVAILADTLNFD